MSAKAAAHDHAHTHAGGAAGGSVRALRAALGVTVTILVLEAVGGVLTGSVALIADAGHMLTDAGALGIALIAARISSRPRDVRRSFGYGRAEILAALANGLLLGGVSVAICIEAIERIANPQPVSALPMLVIASVGLAANLVSARLLASGARGNLNVRAALFHVLGDALGSLAAIAAGLSILLWQFDRADGLAALGIAFLLIASAYRLVRDSVDILLEGAPRHLDLKRIAREVRDLPGVRDIHDLHVWAVTEGFLAMSAHVDLASGSDAETVRRAVHRLLHRSYDIRHTTIQTEAPPELLEIAPGREPVADPETQSS